MASALELGLFGSMTAVQAHERTSEYELTY